MKYTYKLQGLPNKEPICVMRNDGLSIPFDPANTDYQEYLKWLSEGGVVEPADE